MIYAECFPMNDQRRVKVCPYCGNKKFSKKSTACIVCGHSRMNSCIGKMYSHANAGNARYCEICGEKTQFFVDGLLKAWDAGNESSSSSIKEDLPF